MSIEPNKRHLVAAAGLLLAPAQAVLAEETGGFNASFFKGDASALAALVSQNGLLPGTYPSVLYLNGEPAGRQAVTIQELEGELAPCLTPTLLAGLGVSLDDEPITIAADACLPRTGTLVSASYDISDFRLDISVPQKYIDQSVSATHTPVTLWDYGVDAAFVNYALTSQFSRFAGGDQQFHHGRLEGGLNLAGWRLRGSGAVLHDGTSTSWQGEEVYAEHDVTALYGQFAVGQLYGQSSYFASPRFAGAQLYKDEGMQRRRNHNGVLPFSGIAETNATVEVRQNGELIYSENVPPGPFEIRQVPVRSRYGELEYTVVEADGTRRSQMVSFGANPVTLDAGEWDYRLNAGFIDAPEVEASDTWFGSAELGVGVTEMQTLSAGVQGKKDYFSLNLGTALGSRFGAFSFDVTHSDSRTDQERTEHSSVRGQAYRARYSAQLEATGTSLDVATAKYSSSGYRDINQHIADKSRSREAGSEAREKASLSLYISQALPEQWGSLSFQMSAARFWSEEERITFGGAYNVNHGGISYSLGVNNSYTSNDRHDLRYFANVSVPFDALSGRHRIALRNNFSKGGVDNDLGLSGSWDDYDYALAARRNRDGDMSFSASNNLRTGWGDGNLGYSRGAGYQSYSAGWRGGLVFHDGHLFMAPALGDSFTIIEVPDTPNVKVQGARAKTGGNGYTAVANGSPYQRHWVNLDLKALDADIDIDSAAQQVVARRGAITKASFTASSIVRVQFALRDAQGQPLTAGASILSETGQLLAITDPHGQALLMLESESGRLKIKHKEQTCLASYGIARGEDPQVYHRANLQCDS